MLRQAFSTLALLALPLLASATEYRTVEHPRQECWNERVPVQSVDSGYGGAIIGGLAGGILGNQVGGGNGKTVATAVGAMTGALVGDRMSSGSPSYRMVQRCRTVMDYEQVPVVREQAPVWVVREPVQVVEQPVYYIEREEEHHHREHWRENGHERGEHRHSHHDDDED
ncbi:MAG: glycine zipper protein [Herminiimonas sp.]|nr:glycine zipper protein [Herminiimonas sp.]